jgi:hypothetical protein
MKTGPLWLWIVIAIALLVMLSLFPVGDPEHHGHPAWYAIGVPVNDGNITVAILLAIVSHFCVCRAFRGPRSGSNKGAM